jgi:hypothetical protein
MAGSLAILLLAAPTWASGSDDIFSVRRFMLAVGTNNGGPERVMLRYAGSDAQAVAKVFGELGGVEPEDHILLMDPDPARVNEAIAELGERVAAAAAQHSRVEVVVYYSGHSDEEGLLLGGQKIRYQELRSAVDKLPADVRIIILDSCASGAFTRLKGGQRRASFLLDASAQMKGHAFLTSSSDDEAAQESDLIGASFFTHALVSGLRGAADASRDRRVTLNEAYQFAFHATLARTEKTSSGPQHPGYDIQMVGAGDLVMTDLRGTSAGLLLDDQMAGRLHVRDARGMLVVELQKPRGREIELGLEPGVYRLILDRDGEFYGAQMTLPDGERTPLTMAQLTPIEAEFTTIRGAEVPPVRPRAALEDQKILYRDFSFSLLPGLGTNGRNDDRTVSQVSFNLTLGRNRGLDGFELGYIGNWSLGDVKGCQLAGTLNLVEGNLDGVQAAGLINRVWGDVSSLQLSGLVNSVGSDLDGFQGAGFLNVAEGEGRGLQLSGGVNWMSRDFEGAQLAGLANFTAGNLEVAQISGALNAASSLNGLQAAGALNLCRSHAEGAQISGALNLARSLNGAQISVVNITGEARGCQLGVINVARRVNGAQIGVINVAEEVRGAPIGLMSLVRRGRHNATVWGSDTAVSTLGFKIGNEHVYSIFAAGVETLDDQDTDERRFYGLGLGVHLPYRYLFADMDLVSYYIDEADDEPADSDDEDEDLHLLNKARLCCGWQIAPRLAVYGGATINAFTSQRNDGADLTTRTWYDRKEGDTWIKVWPGFFFGVQI